MCVTWPLVVQDARAGILYIVLRRLRLSSPPTGRGSSLTSFFRFSKRDGWRERKWGEKGRRISRKRRKRRRRKRREGRRKKTKGEKERVTRPRAGSDMPHVRYLHADSLTHNVTPCWLRFGISLWGCLQALTDLKEVLSFLSSPRIRSFRAKATEQECFGTLKDDLLLNHQPDIDLKGIYMILETQIRTIP